MSKVENLKTNPTRKPKPPWLVTHTRAHEVARKMAGYEATGSALALPGLAWAALRG